MTNKELYDAALQAITKLFSDQSVSQADTRNNLEELQSEIDLMLDSIA